MIKIKKQQEQEEKKVKDQEEEEKKFEGKKQIEGPSEEFLARNEKAIKNKIPTITDWDLFRKRNKLAPNTKIFIVVGGYKSLKKALLERGWFENLDRNSPVFDLKFAIKQTDVCTGELQDFQIVNHFLKNNLITTKVGLTHSLKNLIWWNNISVDTFFPKCFDLTEMEEAEDFKNEFRFIKAECILKNYVKEQKIKNIVSIYISLHICEKRLKDIDDQLDDPKIELMVTDKEWEVIGKSKISQDLLQALPQQKWYQRVIEKYKNLYISSNSLFEENKENNQTLLQYIQDLLKQLQNVNPQYNMNGNVNIWLVKPGSMSRGRGIKVFNSYNKIMNHIKTAKGRQFVVQKYIENPLIIYKKKFDIRQWVLITDWNPLTIWIYRECYIRFSPIDYDPNEINNKYMHLTNNAIVKHCEEFYESEIEGNMWSCDEFSDYLQEQYQRDVFQEQIWPQIENQVTCSLQSVQDMVENRKNSFEFLGYDFMIDEDLKVWLIEINSSPSMDLSTHVTERLVQLVLSDLPKVIVDYPKAKKKKQCDTGGFVLLHKSKMQVERPQNAMLINLGIEGKKLTKC